MAVYEIVERRCYDETTIIEADNQESALAFEGTVLDEFHTESWAYALLSVSQVDVEDS